MIDKISKFALKHYIILSFITILIYNLVYAGLFYLDNNKIVYIDGDSYTRALRMLDWFQDFQWAEKIFPYSNYPFGDILHFTRIFDIIWGLFSLPLLPLMPLKDAIFYGSLPISPLFLFLSLISLIWAIKPYIKNSSEHKAFAFLYFINLFILLHSTSVFDFNHPDHHPITFFTLVFSISAIIKNNTRPNENYLFGAGILAGINLWASSAVDGYILILPIISILCYNWIFYKKSLSAIVNYTFGTFICLTIAYLIDPPYGGWGVIDNTRLSAIHVITSALIFISFYSLQFANLSRILTKICSTLACAFISALILYAIFTTKLFTPIYTPEVAEYFVPYISEMASLQHTDIIVILIETIAIILLVYLKKHQTLNINNLILLAIIYLPLCILARRISIYEMAVLMFLNSFVLLFLFSNLQKNDNFKMLTFGYIMIILISNVSYRYNTLKYTPAPQMSGCVLTNIFDSPRLVFEQDLVTVDTPYHTNTEAITDAHLIMFATNETELKKLLQKHQVNYIYFPLLVNNEKYPANNSERLYYKLFTWQQNIYPWLENLSVKGQYYLYRINYDLF